MSRRLLIVTPYFPPEMGAPQVRLSELGERLIDRGWAVDAVAAQPSYPTGRIFPGYPTWRTMTESVGRIDTLRIPVYPSNRGFVRRIASYLSFTASAAVFGPRRPRPDVLLVESPPLFAGIAGWALARRFRCPWVFNVSDLWPRSAIEMGVLSETGFPARAAGALESWLYRRADAMTGQSQEIIDDIARRHPEATTCVVTNGVEPKRFGPEQADDDARTLLGSAPGPIFLYAGLLGLAQGLDDALDWVKVVPESVPGRLVLVGDGPLRAHLAARIADEGIHRATLLPAQPRNRIPALLAVADVALVSLGKTLRGAVPSKIYEAMAAGLPILLIAGGEAARRVAAGPSGIVVAPGDTAGIVDAWTQLARDPARRASLGAGGRHEAETRYSRAAVAAHLDALLESLIDGGSER